MPRRKKTLPDSNAAKSKLHEVMHEFKHRTLHSGTSGRIVRKRKQAIAIALSEARKI